RRVFRFKRRVLINKHRLFRCKRREMANTRREIRVSSPHIPDFWADICMKWGQLRSPFPNAQGRRVTWRRALCWAMTEIKLGRIPHSALSIPHLNGSFPVLILGWTIGTGLAL